MFLNSTIMTRFCLNAIIVMWLAHPPSHAIDFFVRLFAVGEGLGAALYMGYLNKTCNAGTAGSTYGSTVGPLLRGAVNGNTWRMFTLTEVGKTAQNEVLVQIKTSYPKSSQKPLWVLLIGVNNYSPYTSLWLIVTKNKWIGAKDTSCLKRRMHATWMPSLWLARCTSTWTLQ